MCRRASCGDCGKPTFKGCGDHVEQVLADVPVHERCRCREQPRPRAAETLATPTADAA
jgi:hypothetical protein